VRSGTLLLIKQSVEKRKLYRENLYFYYEDFLII